MKNKMGTVIPLYQENQSGSCVNLLASVGEFYLKTRSSPLLGDQAREVLGHALAACALDNDIGQYDTLQLALEAYPSADRLAVLETLERLASHYMQLRDGECLQAELFSIPLVITTSQATVDLEPEAVLAIQESLAAHGVIGDDVKVELLPWLTVAPAHADHPIHRQHLVQTILNGTKAADGTAAAAPDLRPVEEPVSIDDETVCVRYLTIALIVRGPEQASQRVTESFWLDAKRKPRVDAWLHDIERAVAAHGQYATIKAVPPAPMIAAEKDGLQECVRIEVAHFVQRAADAADASPDQCALTLSPERTHGLQTSMRLCYVHGDQVLHSVRIGLPCKRADGDFDAVQFAVMSMVGQVAEVLGVSEVRDLDL